MDFRNKNYIEKFSNIENTINSSNLTDYQKVTLLKQIEELIKKRKVVPTSLINLQKNLQRVQQNQTTASRMSSAFDKNRNTIVSGKKFANKKRKLEIELKKLEKNIPEYEIFDILNKSNIASPTLLKSRLNQAYSSDVKKLFNLQKDGKISPGQYADELLNLQTRYEKFAAEIDLYAKNIKDIVGRSLKQKEFQKLKKKLGEVDAEEVKTLQESNKKIKEFLEKNNISPDNPL